MCYATIPQGEKKAAATATKTFLMGIISGCHIAFGALLAITVGGNCPGLASTNPGLQKILFGAFGKLSDYAHVLQVQVKYTIEHNSTRVGHAEDIGRLPTVTTSTRLVTTVSTVHTRVERL